MAKGTKRVHEKAKSVNGWKKFAWGENTKKLVPMEWVEKGGKWTVTDKRMV